MIVFINPYQAQLVSRRGKIYNRVWPPLSLANCAALLELHGHKVRIIDANALRMPPARLQAELEDCERVFVSSSDLDRWQCPSIDMDPFLNTVAAVRRCTEEVYVLGAHGTVRPEEVLRLTKARAVIRGEPESTVSRICQGKPLSEIAGLAFVENGQIRLTETPAPVDLNDLPPPAFHLLPMERYRYEVLGPHFTLLEGSRGCASHCQFCLLQMYGRGVRRKKVEKICAEIDLAVSQGVKTAYFMDLEFTVLRNQVLEICEFLIKRQCGLRWTCQTRLDLIDAHLLKKMKEAGCTLIHFGVEAGSDALLKKLNKGISIDQIREGMRLIQAARIESACFFMLGFPGSNQEEIEQTTRFARQLNPTYALFHIATPYPGTALHEELKQCRPEAVSNVLFPEACCQGHELVRLKSTIRRAYLQFYLRPGYIVSRLRRGNLRSLIGQVRLMAGYL
jgi:anaerobic magnesium-protoporphyrin IX monomethyl ester cyclase